MLHSLQYFFFFEMETKSAQKFKQKTGHIKCLTCQILEKKIVIEYRTYLEQQLFESLLLSVS
jgi:hypothetical protein